MCVGLALDWHWIVIRSGWIGKLDWHLMHWDALASAWHHIDIRLALDWQNMGTGLGWIGTGLTLNWIWIDRIGTGIGLAQDWTLIDIWQAEDWKQIGWMTLYWGQIGDGLTLDWLHNGDELSEDWHWIDIRLAQNLMNWHLIGDGLAMDWQWIGDGLAKDWPRIGNGFAHIDIYWQRIDIWLASDCQSRVGMDWLWIGSK